MQRLTALMLGLLGVAALLPPDAQRQIHWDMSAEVAYAALLSAAPSPADKPVPERGAAAAAVPAASAAEPTPAVPRPAATPSLPAVIDRPHIPPAVRTVPGGTQYYYYRRLMPARR